MRQGLLGPLLAAPSTGIILVFALLPMGFSFYLSLTSWGGLGEAEWVGLENYRRLWEDPRFARYLRQTLVYASVAVPLGVVLPLLLALAIHHLSGPWAVFFRTLYYLPLVTGAVATALLVQALAGLFPQNPFARPETVLPALAVFSVWQGMGSAVLLYLAGLARLPKELYEAAAVDGAGPWGLFRHVTLPGILPVVGLVAVLASIAALQVFEAVFFLTRGGPGDASTTLALFVYVTAFRYFRMGEAAAMAWVLALLLLVLVLIQRRLERGLDAQA